MEAGGCAVGCRVHVRVRTAATLTIGAAGLLFGVHAMPIENGLPDYLGLEKPVTVREIDEHVVDVFSQQKIEIDGEFFI